MGERVSRLWVAMLVVVPLVAGCAARPDTMRGGAPAPDGSAAGVPAGVVPAAAVGSGAARPSPTEYRSVPELADIHFDFDKYDIRADAARKLDTGAAWLKANPGYLVLIEGHADERGTNEYNLALGDRRAKASVNYLVSHGVAASRFTTLSYGEERGMCRERSEGCWAKNRRAHFGVKAR